MPVFTCYLDESGTDQTDSQIAVVGGLLLKMSESYWARGKIAQMSGETQRSLAVAHARIWNPW